jgi:glutathione S-transferase
VYVIPASPPCACIEAALRIKGVSYDRTVLPNVLHIAHQLVRFGRPTVPAITMGRERIVGSRAIVRRLDMRWPDPPLYGGPEIDEAERWGDEQLQPVARRMAGWTTSHHPDAVPSFFEGADLVVPMPAPLLRRIAPGVTKLARLRAGAGDDAVRRDLRELPGMLGRVERWLDEGVLGAERPNAADLQIASVLRLLLVFGDVAPIVERHPGAAALARRHFPDWPGRVPAGVLPADWLP